LRFVKGAAARCELGAAFAPLVGVGDRTQYGFFVYVGGVEAIGGFGGRGWRPA